MTRCATESSVIKHPFGSEGPRLSQPFYDPKPVRALSEAGREAVALLVSAIVAQALLAP